MNEIKKNRIYYFDNIKGILILFAIFYHSVSVGADYYNYNDSFVTPVLLFMIPGFLFVTGYFCGLSKKNPWKNVWKMFLIYALVQLAVTFYFADILHIISNHWDLAEPAYTLWYLLTIVYCYILSIPIKKIGFKWSMIISIILALLVGFTNIIGPEFSVSRTITLLPFFILGMFSKEINYFEFIKKFKVHFIILAIILYILYIIFPHFLPTTIVYGKFDYITVFGNNLEGIIKRMLVLIYDFIFLGAFLSLISKKKSIISIIGTLTLVIYILHGVILKTYSELLPMPINSVVGTILLFVLTCIVSIGLAFLYEKIKKLFNNRKKLV